MPEKDDDVRPDAESMAAEQRTGLQGERLPVLADRLLALEAVRVVQRAAGEPPVPGLR